MPARTGAAFLRGLRDNREVWLGATRVTDPLDHPDLRGAAEAIAAVFDLHYQYPDDCLMPDPDTGEAIAVSHIIPRSPRGPAAPAQGAAPGRRVLGWTDGSHPRLYERDLRRLRRSQRRMGH